MLCPDCNTYAAENEIVVVDGLTVSEIKTKPFQSFLAKVGAENKALVVTDGKILNPTGYYKIIKG